jgi:hypothetical protein
VEIRLVYVFCRSLDASVAQHSLIAPQLAARLGHPIENRTFSGML